MNELMKKCAQAGMACMVAAALAGCGDDRPSTRDAGPAAIGSSTPPAATREADASGAPASTPGSAVQQGDSGPAIRSNEADSGPNLGSSGTSGTGSSAAGSSAGMAASSASAGVDVGNASTGTDVGSASTGAGGPAGGEALAKKSCGNCHVADAKKVGPSWKDIARKHKGDDADKVVAAMKAKPVHGNALKALSDDEIKQVVSWMQTQ